MIPRPLKWFKNCVQKLGKVDEVYKHTLLRELYITLLSSSHSQIVEVAPSLQLSNVFDCLFVDNKEHVYFALKILEYAFSGLNPESILEEHGDQLVRIIQLPQIQIKEFVIDELKKIIINQNATKSIYARMDLLAVVVECISDKIGVADRAMCLLKMIGKDREGLRILYSEPIISSIFAVLQKNDTICLRMYEVLISFCLHSASSMEQTDAYHLLDGLSTLLRQGDMLTKMCTLEEVKKLGTTYYGYQYLTKNYYLTFLFKEANDYYLDPSKIILIMSVFELFAIVASHEPFDVFSEYPQMASQLFSLVESDNDRLQHLGLKTIAQISLSEKGKLALANFGETFDSLLDTICQMILHENFISKAIALNCVCNLIKIDDKNKNEELIKLTEKWFKRILPAFKTFVDLCTNSVDQVNLSALSALDSLAQLEWGQQLIANVPGCVEMLTRKDGCVSFPDKVRHLKCRILKSLVSSKNAESTFPIDVLHRFHVFIGMTESRTNATCDVATISP